MRIAFITPTLHTLGRHWEKDPQIVKLAAPTLSGFLYSRGYTDLRQYDFEVQMFEVESAQPGLLNLKAFFDDEAVDRYIAGEDGEDGEIAAQVEVIFEGFDIAQADLFAFSCASVLEIYADMHCAGNIIIAMCHELKRRFPDSKTAVGGLQMSPDTLHAEEYRSMLRRCSGLDFAAEGSGESALWMVLKHMEGEAEIATGAGLMEKVGDGILISRIHEKPENIPKKILREEEALGRLPERFATPDEAPEGDHERVRLDNPSIQNTPWFDPVNLERRKIKGSDLIERYHLGPVWTEKMAPWLDDDVVIIPQIFLEGCNARCAFCSYSMTTMAKRQIDDVVRGLAWIRDTYDVKYFHFLNTNINGYMKYAEAFCDALIAADLGIYWSDCANLWALNERVMDKLVQSGCIRLTFGLECPSPRMLEYILKGIDVETAHERLQYLDKLGIWNHLLLITGLPTETPEDTEHFIEFLERSRDYVHGYSISSFYLIESSLMGAFPERFGLEMLPNDSGLLENQAFDEKGGLKWAEKKQQIRDSTEIITNTIKRIKPDPKYTSGAIDLELLFWLYDRLGHGRKAEIVQAYEQAWLGAPGHPKYYSRDLARLLGEPAGEIGEALEQSGLVPRLDALVTRPDAIVLPFSAGRDRLDMTFRVKENAGDGYLAAGEQLLIEDMSSHVCRTVIDRLAAPGGKLARALGKAGWSIDSSASQALGTNGFRITHGEAAIDVAFALAGADAPAFRRAGNLTMSYSVPHGSTDRTGDAQVMALLKHVGDYVLSGLGSALGDEGAVDAEACQRLARALVDELERPHLDWAQRDTAERGQRYGNKFSRVAPDRGY